MTNEFIVFIKDDCEFWTTEEIKENSELDLIYDWENNKLTLVRFNSGDGYTPEEGEFSNPTWEKVDCDFFDYIGKTDINGKKIYPDCSIVEFEIILRRSVLPIKGYFYFDKTSLKYKIKVLEDLGDDGRTYGLGTIPYSTYRTEIENLKIIDTIQENKLGLIK